MKNKAFEKNTDLGFQIRLRLLELNKTQEWLIRQVKDLTGLYFDSSYLYRIMTGKSTSPKIISAICKILEIEYLEKSKVIVNEKA